MGRSLPLRLGTVLAPLLVATLAAVPPAYAAGSAELTSATIKTEVIDNATGAPVEGICVFATPVLTFSFPDICPVRSNSAGKVTVPVSEPGSYNLFALPDSGSQYGAQWVGPDGGTGSQKTARRITLAVGDTKSAPKIRLDLRATITGTAHGMFAPPVENGTVGIVAPDPYGRYDPRYSPVAADKTFRIDWLGPYEWPLLFKADNFPYQWSGGVGNRMLAELVPATIGGSAPYVHYFKLGTKVSINVPGEPPGVGRLVIRNVATQDPIGLADFPKLSSGAALLILGGQQVKLQCLCSTGIRWHGGTDFDSATPEVIHTIGLPYITFAAS